MTTELRALFSRSRLISFLPAAVAAFLYGFLLSHSLVAGPAEQALSRGAGTGSLQLSLGQARLPGAEPIRVLLSPNQ